MSEHSSLRTRLWQTASWIKKELRHVVPCSSSPDKTGICFVYLDLTSLFCKMSGEGWKMMMTRRRMEASSIYWTGPLSQAPSELFRCTPSFKPLPQLWGECVGVVCYYSSHSKNKRTQKHTKVKEVVPGYTASLWWHGESNPVTFTALHSKTLHTSDVLWIDWPSECTKPWKFRRWH